MIYVWIFPLMARFENSCAANLKNASILALAYFPRSIAMAAITAVVPFVLTLSLRLLPLALFFGLSLPGYLCMFVYKSVMKQMVERALGGPEEDRTGQGELFASEETEGLKEPADDEAGLKESADEEAGLQEPADEEAGLKEPADDEAKPDVAADGNERI